MTEELNNQSLAYHESFPPGKLQIASTKRMETQADLSLAYSPGVSQPCREIAKDGSVANKYTARGNLVAVITNGTAVLGLGNIGPLAAKPVMEGKAILFKKFSGIDAFDLEIDENNIDKFCDIVVALEPTFGAINLEDIKAPECFMIEKQLRSRMSIPVFHDDQHGTAVVVTAALINALKITEKSIGNIRIVCNGAGAAAIACMDLLVKIGAKKNNIILCDLDGVIRTDRSAENLDPYKYGFATDRDIYSLEEAVSGADVFIGLSAAGMMSPVMVRSMSSRPIIFAMANPDPEIMPELVTKVRDDAIIATGRSDFPNQVNNVLCFPLIFRGALDVGATEINDEMKIACARAIAKLAEEVVGSPVLKNGHTGDLHFGPGYIIPTPFDPRLITRVVPAVAQAAVDSGVATRPIKHMKEYLAQLENL